MNEENTLTKNTVIKSFLYKFIERFAVKGIGLLISIILARLLEPQVFGFVAILNIFISLSTSFVQSGLNTALIQNKTVDNIDYSTVFYISFALAMVFILIINLIAPIIAKFYENLELVLPLRVFSFSLLIGAFNSVQVAKATREMRFRAMMICSLVSTVLSGVVGIILALLGFGLWALVVYTMVQELLYSIVLLMFSRWLPEFCFSKKRAKELFGYGWKLLVSSILCNIYSDIRTLIIGKRFSPSDLAFYNRGDQFPSSITVALNSAIQSVMLPVLSNYQDSKERLYYSLKQSISLSSILILPAMFGLSAVSRPLVLTILGEKWSNSIVYLQILSFAYGAIPFSSPALIAIQATGRSDIYLTLEIKRRIIMVIILAISVFCFDSIIAIAVCYVISSWIDVAIVINEEKKLVGYGVMDQIHDTWHSFIASAIMAVAVYCISLININSIVLLLIIQLLSGVILYCAIMLLFKDSSFSYLLSLLFDLARKFKKTQVRK